MLETEIKKLREAIEALSEQMTTLGTVPGAVTAPDPEPKPKPKPKPKPTEGQATRQR